VLNPLKAQPLYELCGEMYPVTHVGSMGLHRYYFENKMRYNLRGRKMRFGGFLMVEVML